MSKLLTYDVVEPTEGNPEHAPWIVVCHGLGDSRHGWLQVVPYLQLPTCGFIVVDAPRPYYGGYSWFRIPGLTGENDGPEDFRADFHASLQQFAELLAHIHERYAVSAQQLFLMGFSQGCQMVVAQALRSAETYRGVVGISGRLGDIDDYPQVFGPAAKAQDMLITHGLWDPLLPIDHSRAQFAHLRDDLGLRIDWREYGKEHSLDPERELPEIRQWIQARR